MKKSIEKITYCFLIIAALFVSFVSFVEPLVMKDININCEGLSFEEKIKLKMYYLYSLPNCKEKESILGVWVVGGVLAVFSGCRVA